MPTKRLLIVEDDNEFIERYKKYITERCSWITLDEVVFVKTPHQARRHITDGIKVVITDHRLIGGTGDEIVEWAKDIFEEVRFIRCSSECEGDYPPHIRWYNKFSQMHYAMDLAHQFLLHVRFHEFQET